MRGTNVTRWMRGGGIALAVLALAASAVEVSREGKGPVPPIPAATARNPLTVELERCNRIAPTPGRDDACERAWAENRRRFLGASGRSPDFPSGAVPQPAIAGDRP